MGKVIGAFVGAGALFLFSVTAQGVGCSALVENSTCHGSSSESGGSSAATEPSDPHAPAKHNLNVKFEFSGNADCRQKLTSGLAGAEGELILPNGGDAAGYCNSLYPAGIREEPISSTLLVSFQFASESSCEADITSTVGGDGGQVILGENQTAHSYCQSLAFGSQSHSNSQVAEGGSSGERGQANAPAPEPPSYGYVIPPADAPDRIVRTSNTCPAGYHLDNTNESWGIANPTCFKNGVKSEYTVW